MLFGKMREYIEAHPEMRAQLVLTLLEQGNVDLAVQSSLALVGTEHDYLFLYARAWQLKSQGDDPFAQQILDEAFKQRGLAHYGGKLEYSDGYPVLHEFFDGTQFLKCPPADQLMALPKTHLSHSGRPQGVLEEANLWVLLYEVYPLLPFSFSHPEDVQRSLVTAAEDAESPLHPFQAKVASPESLQSLAREAERLARRADYRSNSTATLAAFFLLASNLGAEAEAHCRSWAYHRPDVAGPRNFLAAALYCQGKRYRALQIWRESLSQSKGQTMALAMLGAACVRERRYERAGRYWFEVYHHDQSGKYGAAQFLEEILETLP